MRIAGATALVSGANRGLGHALALALLDRDVAKLYVTSRRGGVDDLVAADPGRVHALELELTDPDSVAAAAGAANDVTLLINNAAKAAFTMPMAADAEAVAAEMATNYLGTFTMMRAFAPVIEAAGGGAIVNVLSMSALATIPSMSGYSASKAASHSMTQALRSELRPLGIAVHGAYPGGIATDMLARPDLPSTSPEDVAKGILDGLEAGSDYIFPCPLSRGGSEVYLGDPLALERALENVGR